MQFLLGVTAHFPIISERVAILKHMIAEASLESARLIKTIKKSFVLLEQFSLSNIKGYIPRLHESFISKISI